MPIFEAIRNHNRILPTVMLGVTLLSACSSDVNQERTASQGTMNTQAPEPVETSPSMKAELNEGSDTTAPNVCNPADPSGFHGPGITGSGSQSAKEVLFCEEVQATGGADVFERYEDASRIATRLKVGSAIGVRCVQVGPAEAAPSAATDPDRPGAIWYEIGLPTELAGNYVAANTFWNVRDKSIPFDQQPVADQRVPDCTK